MKLRRAPIVALAALLLVVGAAVLVFFERQAVPPPLSSALALVCDPARIEALYSSWAARHEAGGGDRSIVVRLAWSKAYSAEFTRTTGVATLDLIAGSVAIETSGQGDTTLDVWLVESRPGPNRSAMPEAGDDRRRIGSVTPRNGAGTLHVEVGDSMQGFHVDQILLCRSGEAPEGSGVIFGSPHLFQRRYTRLRELSAAGDRAAAPAKLPSFETLIRHGATLFFEETFAGNGRTCGTCHPAGNNLTLDPDFIATLPADDPLFVAEFVPELAQNFENPRLMREVGLILENVDGFDDLSSKFVMRGVPHTLAQSTSIAPAPPAAGGSVSAPQERTGWSGDGAPGSGTLREFANGAIRQHFTRTLARKPGADFRFATDDELDAMEAFLLSLGRDVDPDDIAALQLRSEVVARGRDIFLTGDSGEGAAGKCNVCHANAGASVSFAPGGFNFNFDTGVENLPDQPADLLDAGNNPPDGGFGGEPNPGGGFGDGTFNTPPLIEAADTGPFFHNHAVATIEEAVGFYNSAAFNASPAGAFLAGSDANGIGIRLEATQVVAVAAFLRVMNALENIRAATEAATCAEVEESFARANPLLRLAGEEAADAHEVLSCAGLHPPAVRDLENAVALFRRAAAAHSSGARLDLISKALDAMRSASRDMVADSPE